MDALTLTTEFQITRLWETLKFGQICKDQESQLEETLHWAETVPIVTNFPQKSLDEIIPTAARDKSNWRNFSRSIHIPDNAPREVLETWAYTYLKHAWTNYDDPCNQLKNHAFSCYVYPTLLHRVNVLILDRYPFTIRLRGDNGSPSRRAEDAAGLDQAYPLVHESKAERQQRHPQLLFPRLRDAPTSQTHQGQTTQREGTSMDQTLIASIFLTTHIIRGSLLLACLKNCKHPRP